jgi:hypothetical protein
VQTEQPREPLPDPSTASADQLRAVRGPFVGQAGTFELRSSDVVTMQAIVAKNPSAMTKGAVSIFTHRRDGNALTLTQARTPSGPVSSPATITLTRVESRFTSPRFARFSSPSHGQNVESDLAEVTIGGNHGGQPQLTHHRKAGAVGERQVLITIVEEEIPRSFETIVLDTLPSQPGAAIDLLPPCVRGRKPEAKPKQG